MNSGAERYVQHRTIGAWIAAERELLDETQTEMAAALGCERGHLSRIETNKEKPSKQLALAIATHLNIPSEHVADVVRALRRLPPASPPAYVDVPPHSPPLSAPDTAHTIKAQALIICIPLLAPPDPTTVLEAVKTVLGQLNTAQDGQTGYTSL